MESITYPVKKIHRQNNYLDKNFRMSRFLSHTLRFLGKSIKFFHKPGRQRSILTKKGVKIHPVTAILPKQKY